MSNINYIRGIIKILDKPQYKYLKNNIIVTHFRAQFQNTYIVYINILNKFSNNNNLIKDKYYLIEGYINIFNLKRKNFKKSRLQKFKINIRTITLI